jgi:hypothetical protein
MEGRNEKGREMRKGKEKLYKKGREMRKGKEKLYKKKEEKKERMVQEP